MKATKINLVAFGIARDILQASQMSYEAQFHNIGELRSSLFKDFPEFQKLNSLSFAVNEEYQEETFPLADGLEVVIIPPVSGG